MECNEKKTFQFRKNRYNYGGVINGVSEEINAPYCRKKYNQYLSNHSISEPSADAFKMFGDSVLREYETKTEIRNKNAVREVLNCGFNRVIKGGSNTYLPFLPEEVSAIDRDHICQMIDVIRGTRVVTVHRAYSRRF